MTHRILSNLVKNEKATFRQIQKQTEISPRILQKYLKDLVSHRLVNEKGRKDLVDYKITEKGHVKNLQRPKKLLYSLTKKGRAYWYREPFAVVAEALRKVHDLTKDLSNLGRLSELRTFLNQPFMLESEDEELRNGTLTLEQWLERFEVRSRKSSRTLLTESLKSIFNIYLEVSLRPFEGRDLVMGITKEGYVCLIPVASLKKHGLGVSL